MGEKGLKVEVGEGGYREQAARDYMLDENRVVGKTGPSSVGRQAPKPLLSSWGGGDDSDAIARVLVPRRALWGQVGSCSFPPEP